MYTALGAVYDLFRPQDDDKRAEYLCKFLPAGDGVDLGCGTGGLTAALVRRGLHLFGVDESEDMLRVALSKYGRIPFVQSDVSAFPYAHPLHFAVASNDVFNYVPRLNRAFVHVYKALKSGGTFAFDLSTPYKLKTVLGNNTFSETKEDVTYIWQNECKGNKLYIDFTVFSPCDGTYIKTCESQVQYLHKPQDVTAALGAAGFNRIKTYAYYTRNAPKENTERILFVAKKNGENR